MEPRLAGGTQKRTRRSGRCRQRSHWHACGPNRPILPGSIRGRTVRTSTCTVVASGRRGWGSIGGGGDSGRMKGNRFEQMDPRHRTVFGLGGGGGSETTGPIGVGVKVVIEELTCRL